MKAQQCLFAKARNLQADVKETQLKLEKMHWETMTQPKAI